MLSSESGNLYWKLASFHHLVTPKNKVAKLGDAITSHLKLSPAHSLGDAIASKNVNPNSALKVVPDKANLVSSLFDLVAASDPVV